ncbi:hypothetical protein Glove_166g272 [Diversispora epigaea]|uniref:Uncharacterized protein n=1 Tax=Diversispora epigaea TaxID=1348612 RepID=A0A397IQF9_9GLOM|nr:hypothetical protein Glove_166g272 [Diversispora epigaea]
MAKRLDCKIRGTIQNETNNHTFRPGGNNNNLAQISSDTDYYFLGCLGSSLDLCISTFKEDEIRDANRLFDEKSGTPSGKLNNNSTGSTGSKIAPINRECNVLEGYFETKRKSCEIHDGCVNSLRSTNECTGRKFKGTEHADTSMGSGCEECPNRGTIGEMQTRFGKLLRIGSLGGNAWKPTTPKKTCRRVFAHSRYIQEESSVECHTTMSQVRVCDEKDESPLRCDNTLILVDTFEDKSRIATSINLKILDSDPKELIYYITCIAEFGFDHIIIIGETYDGVIFLDCYGRVFLWDDENLLLCPFGNSPEEASKYSFKKDRLGWFVKNGIVYEYILKFEYM